MRARAPGRTRWVVTTTPPGRSTACQPFGQTLARLGVEPADEVVRAHEIERPIAPDGQDVVAHRQSSGIRSDRHTTG